MTKKTRIITGIAVSLVIALCVATYCGYIVPPLYSAPTDKKVSDGDLVIEQSGRKLTVENEGSPVWALPENVLAQDFLYEDIDRDGKAELLVLCWKRGRYGKHRPTWVESDEIKWSQHIFIYNIADGQVIPKWMASDIGMHARSWEAYKGVITITDTSGDVTKWGWIHWGLEKL
ncbi:MAG: hypothetical protein K6G67_05325 [Lachnospiraceae bacterium]|nr:hypothetical protein [Lachnospiraceae bacterium]